MCSAVEHVALPTNVVLWVYLHPKVSRGGRPGKKPPAALLYVSLSLACASLCPALEMP